MFSENVLFAFGLTLFAGLSTGIGSLLGFFTKKTNTKFLSISLGFSAGVMIYVSLVEILQQAQMTLVNELGKSIGGWVTIISFFGGMFIIALIDKVIPEEENPHSLQTVEDLEEAEEEMETKSTNSGLMRMGIMSALAIGIHNFPEGLATFAAALKDPTIAVPIAIAIAIHNIPEGIAVSVPIYYATGDRKKAFTYSFLSGLSEPLGAIIGYLLLYRFLNDTIFGIIFALVAGIMVFISLDELLPASEKYGEHHLSIYGLIGGMAVMAISLVLLG
ncbi:zinc transporter permease protein ZupT [Gottschalkia acidurici 9a]|uniref:Zinc transporter ZupT n=1 Tax=Gottschalkia acidurici (strain ATCC 7906 / DSM 604 / BCRC 14475 / CIP 104303 / KCTC 5404 / NCIMB 10678 / 9a) TaxID=1128398 RepID=K0B3H9_GOTA9|nr:zinc transporter ZupT [Gottschalkia acidurici]AFS79176.1 zinc transporter permease protein ZupT [Gottschalkia acidurici 9a]